MHLQRVFGMCNKFRFSNIFLINFYNCPSLNSRMYIRRRQPVGVAHFVLSVGGMCVGLFGCAFFSVFG